jgi:quercetin 2,3-dioxygenase
MTTLRYTRDELMTDHDDVEPHFVAGRRVHGGFLADGTYVPPRTKVRQPAVDAWTEALRDRGGDVLDADASLLEGARLPNVEQQRVLLRNGLGESFWNSLTIIGKIEAKGRLLADIRFPDLQDVIVEDISEMAIGHLNEGLVDHADSLGAAARYGKGDVQWMTAGRGIQHAEMFPLLDQDGPNPMELFQIWLNLPAEDKMVEPSYEMLWDSQIPRVPTDGEGEITVIAGAIPGPSGLVVPPSPAPDSWAAREDTDVALWHVRLGAGASATLPPARFDDTVRVLYVFDGDGVALGGRDHDVPTGIVVDSAQECDLRALGQGVDVLVMQGRPIGEPVAQYGPFVMNTREEIQQAFADYQRDQFGGWPWDRSDPVHGRDPQRFARHADGREELAAS